MHVNFLFWQVFRRDHWLNPNKTYKDVFLTKVIRKLIIYMPLKYGIGCFEDMLNTELLKND